MKNKVEARASSKSKELTAIRGTAIWAFNQFREDALVQLMIDLMEKETSGLEDGQAEIVTQSLEKVALHLSAMPDKFWIRTSVMEAFDKFKEAFLKWKNINGSDQKSIESRRKVLKKMRDERHKLATVTRKNMFILSQALDLKLIENIYEALSLIPRALPEIFANLGKALLRINKKKTEG